MVIRLPPSQPEQAVKLRDLATPLPQQLPPPVASRVVAAPRRVIVKLVAYERDAARLALAMDMLRDESPPSPSLRMWRENGLLFASIDRSRLPLLLANLPKPLGGRVFTLYSAGVESPVTLIDRIQGRHRVEMVEPDNSLTERRFFGGEYRLLLRLWPAETADPTAPMQIELLPQHYSPSRSLLLQQPTEPSRQGYNFDQLQIVRSIGANEVWLITADPAARTDTPFEDPGPQPRSAAAPVSLGQAMLTGERRGTPVRLMLLISLEPEAGEP